MRIVIDLQGAQGASRYRGIGRYSMSLVKAVVSNRGEHEIILALNGLFHETIEPIRDEFDSLLPQINIRVWYVPGSVNNHEEANNWKGKSAELIREAFLASLEPDVILITSIFEGLEDDYSVVSIDALSNHIPVAAILYDLIPLINHQIYLENPVVKAWYEKKIDYLKRADLILAISESTRKEGVDYLELPEEMIVNISSAVDSRFQPQEIDQQKKSEIQERYKLDRPFVMYTGSNDYRKNIDGLIRAYAKLPGNIRAQYCLAIVYDIALHDKARFEDLAKKHKLGPDELIFTGFINEEDLSILYNLCKLFVFPSWHEGFGLPILEAMSCGKAVIGSNISSIPEVIGREDALFDPKSDDAIASKLLEVLTDDVFRVDLEKHGLEQAKKFSWDTSAALAVAALEKLHKKHQKQQNAIRQATVRRPKMAYISPLPPEPSGIADYSAELLPELSRYYDIDVIISQGSVSDPWVTANAYIRSVEWFKSHASEYQRILYHFGNSPFHQHMFDLLKEISGVVVLHDFFLSGVVAHMDVNGLVPNGWAEELYRSHGYNAIKERFHTIDNAEVECKYPCNLSVLRSVKGIIIHSAFARRLLETWYSKYKTDCSTVIPHLRASAIASDRLEARNMLKLNDDDFIICSFGMLGPIKLNHCLLSAWLASDLAKDSQCVLIFVGENDEGEYGRELLAKIQSSGLSDRIHITGWVDSETFKLYLNAADISVQLRTRSRGESSGTVLDCMNHGLPTIINAHGSMADYSSDTVWKIPDEFTDEELIEAIEILWKDKDRRKQLANKACEAIKEHHSPRSCAKQYFEAIEAYYLKAETDVDSLIQAISKINSIPSNSDVLIPLAESVARSIPMLFEDRQLLVDISALARTDLRTGIQRVVRSILINWLNNPPQGLRVEPVYLADDQVYRYAHRFTLEFLDCPTDLLNDVPMHYQAGDIFIGLDFHSYSIVAHRNFFQQLRRHGVQVQFVVYDLLSILMPHCFPDGSEEIFHRWLEVVAENDGAVCISKSVAVDLDDWIGKHGKERRRPFKISWFHLGADIRNSNPSVGLPDNAINILQSIRKYPSFLMVSTIEPRKGYTQTLEAFEQLWSEGMNVNLVIVGKQGWMVEKLIEKLRQHPERGKHLFWFEGVSDEYLEKIYAVATCLIAASEGEGFGLPLIEAAQHKLPIIARDIPVFKEVAGEFAFYFSGLEPNDLAWAVKHWLGLFEIKKHTSSCDMPWLTWSDSAEQLLTALGLNASEESKLDQ